MLSNRDDALLCQIIYMLFIFWNAKLLKVYDNILKVAQADMTVKYRSGF